MNDFLQRLMYRNLGQLSLARPRIAPRYAAFEGRHGFSRTGSSEFLGEINEEIEAGSPRNRITPQEGKGQSLTPEPTRDSDSDSSSPDTLTNSIKSRPESESPAGPGSANRGRPEDPLPPRTVSDQNTTGETKLINNAFIHSDKPDRIHPGKKNLESNPEETDKRTRRDHSTANTGASSPSPATRKREKLDVTGNSTSGETLPTKSESLPDTNVVSDHQASHAGHTPPSTGKTVTDFSRRIEPSHGGVPQSGEETIFDTVDRRPSTQEENPVRVTPKISPDTGTEKTSPEQSGSLPGKSASGTPKQQGNYPRTTSPVATKQRVSDSPAGEDRVVNRGESRTFADDPSKEAAMETTLSPSHTPTHPAISKAFIDPNPPSQSARDHENRMSESDIPVTEIAMEEVNSESVVQRKILPGTGPGMKSSLPSSFATPVKHSGTGTSPGEVGSPGETVHGVKTDTFNPGATHTATESSQNRSEKGPVAEHIEDVAKRLAATQTPSVPDFYHKNKGFETGEVQSAAESDPAFDSSRIVDPSHGSVELSGEENIFNTEERRPALQEANAPFTTEYRESDSPARENPVAYREEPNTSVAHPSREATMKTTLSPFHNPTHPAISKEFITPMTPSISAQGNADRISAAHIPAAEIAMEEVNPESVVQRKTLPGTGPGMKSAIPAAFATPVKYSGPGVFPGEITAPGEAVHGVKQNQIYGSDAPQKTNSFSYRNVKGPAAEQIENVAERLASTFIPSVPAYYSSDNGFESGETRSATAAASYDTFDSLPVSEAFSDNHDIVSDTSGRDVAVSPTGAAFAFDAGKHNPSFPRTGEQYESLPRMGDVPRNFVRESIFESDDRSAGETTFHNNPGLPHIETNHQRPEAEHSPRANWPVTPYSMRQGEREKANLYNERKDETDKVAQYSKSYGESEMAAPSVPSSGMETAHWGFDRLRQDSPVPGTDPAKPAFLQYPTKTQAPFEPYTFEQPRRYEKRSDSPKESSGPVRVNIGFIDVRSTPEPVSRNKTEAPERQSSSVISLNDYLKRREEEGA